MKHIIDVHYLLPQRSVREEEGRNPMRCTKLFCFERSVYKKSTKPSLGKKWDNIFQCDKFSLTILTYTYSYHYQLEFMT